MKKNNGLSLVEVLIVVSLLAILFGLGSIVFGNFAKQDRLGMEVRKIVAIIDEARAKTLAGYSLGGSSGLNFGVHFAAGDYTLFSGTTFDPDEAGNQRYSLSSGLTISEIAFASGNIIFEKISGEVSSFDPVQNYLVLSDQGANQSKKIRVNKIGVAVVE